MNDHPRLQPALSHRAPRTSQLRSTSGSPTRQRHADDLLSRLTPRTAVEALSNPTGELKKCMDAASPGEQAFAMRVAVASKNIQEWLEELSSWPWPTHDTSAGFARPPAKRRKLFERSASDNGLDSPERGIRGEDSYLGSLLASDVAAYERRAHDIGRDMEDLNVEEIKNHILHNHIMPLSRPGTPMSDTFRASTMSASVYAHMDDFTALITATIVQALPNLSKLTRLLHTWSIRLLILGKSPGFLTALLDAEIALKAGWKAVNPGRNHDTEVADEPVGKGPVLSRGEFDVMKPVVERKVAKAGQGLDFMLDVMEGREDTLPDDWIDRMDAVEQDYADWVATCERHIREAEWAKLARPVRTSSSADSVGESTASSVQPDHMSVAEREDRTQANSDDGTVTSPPAIMVHPAAEDVAAIDGPESQTAPADETTPEVPSSDETSDLAKDAVSQLDRLDDTGSSANVHLSGRLLDRHALSDAPDSTKALDPLADSPGHTIATELSDTVLKQPASQVLEEEDEFPASKHPEPDLPTLPHERRGSEVSNASTVVHGLQSGFGDFSSDPPDQGTPDYHRFRDVVLPSTESDGVDAADDTDLPSSPPDFRSSTRSLSVSFNDILTVVEAPEEEEDDDETLPDTPLDASFGAADDLSRLDSPSKSSGGSADDQLQQQISEILDTIPAKIRLASEPSAINLNPPDFSMPAAAPRPKGRDSLPPRSYSSLSNRSSRAGTPSFTLAPAKTPRPRHQPRGNQEIKLYHLSRSNGEPPIKLFIRCVGDKGERVMVRVGGGWADLGEYLKEYASHHGRRGGGEAKVEVRDLPRISTTASPPSRPASAMDTFASSSPVTPLNVRKARRSIGSSAGDDLRLARQPPQQPPPLPKTPLAHTATTADNVNTPASSSSSSGGGGGRSRSSSRLSWTEEDSQLGMAGPKSKHIELSDERKAWVESAKEKVRLASGDQRAAAAAALALAANNRSPASYTVPARVATPVVRAATPDAKLLSDNGVAAGKFGELGKVGSTKRLFVRKNATGTGTGTGNGFGMGK